MIQRRTPAQPRRLIWTVVLPGVCAWCAMSAPPAGALTPPSQDPFYGAPPALAAYAPGSILRSRQVTLQGPAQADSSGAYQLLVRSTDAQGSPIAAVTTLIIPSTPASGTRDLLSYQTFEDALSTNCAPSYTMRGGSSGGSYPFSGTESAEQALIAKGLQQGWDVVVPDHEGPQSSFVLGPLEGRVTLDSIRAVEHFAPADLEGSRTPVGMMGYSGGAAATVWANSLAPSYAPELHVVGVGAGGIPANVAPNIQSFDGGPFAGVVVGVLVSVQRAYPELDLNAILNAAGKTLATQDGADASGCGGVVFNAPYEQASAYSNYPTVAALLAVPRVKRVFAHLNLIPGPYPSAPSYFYNAVNDELAPIPPVDQLVAADCTHGAKIDYYRSPAGEHLVGIAGYAAPAMSYLADRFAGAAVPDTCPPTATKPPAPRGRPNSGGTPHKGCPAASGRLSGRTLGRVRLGMTRAQARRVFSHSADRGKRYQDFFCLTPRGIRVGYASPALLRTLPLRVRRRFADRVVWASTAGAFYALRGIRPGSSAAAAARVLRVRARFHVGLNWWYLGPDGAAMAVLKVRHGVVEEIGIGEPRLLRGRRRQLMFLRSFGWWS